jgi:predicted porin
MKKSFVALACLSCLSAFAQTAPTSALTVYGVADLSLNNDSKTSSANSKVETRNVITNGLSTSRLGVRGERELTKGLRASYVFEFEVDQSSDSGISKTRVGTVGLAGSFGALSVGRRNTLMKDLENAFDPNDGPTAAGYLGDNSRDSRRDDVITWSSPSIKGFSVDAQVGFGSTQKTTPASGVVATSSAGVRDDGKSGDSVSFGLNYSAGPLTLKAGTESVKNFYKAIKVGDNNLTVPGGSATDPARDRTHTMVGASYKLDFVTVYYVSTRAEQGTVALKSTFNTDNFGVRVPLGAWTFNLGLGQGKANVGSATAVLTAKADLKATQASVWYAFNRETTLYAVYGNEKVTHATFAVPQKQNTFLVGMRYRF